MIFVVIGSSPHLISQLKNQLHKNFKTLDLGPIQRTLGVQFKRNTSGLRMHQTQYALSVVHQFQMDHYAPCHTPLPEGMVLSKKQSNTSISSCESDG